jgi:hypothetical protein
MSFKIWDNHFGGYMRDVDGMEIAEFSSKLDADRAIENFIRTRDRKEEWSFRLDVEHATSNLCYHLVPIYRGDQFLHHRPTLLPIDYRVPKSHWKLFAENGSELSVGMILRTWRDEEVELIDMTPPHRMASSGEVTCIDGHSRKNWWYPRVINGSYRYVPPEDSSNAAALRWASEKWVPTRPLDIPPARKILLPRPIWELPHGENILG